jgi:hypothetical protein
MAHHTGYGNCLRTDYTTKGESQSITVSFWLYPKEGRYDAAFVLKSYYTDLWVQRCFCFYVGWTNGFQTTQITAGIRVGGDYRTATCDEEDGLVLNCWSFVAITYDKDTGSLTLYVNGSQVAQNAGDPGAINWGLHGDWNVLGNRHYLDAMTPNAGIDDLRIADSALGEAALNALYAAGIGA